MKDLQNYGVQELSTKESMTLDGGKLKITLKIKGLFDGIKGNTEIEASIE